MHSFHAICCNKFCLLIRPQTKDLFRKGIQCGCENVIVVYSEAGKTYKLSSAILNVIRCDQSTLYGQSL